MTNKEAKKLVAEYVYNEHESIPFELALAFSVMTEANERRIPKKPSKMTDGWNACKNCGVVFGESHFNYCPDCGQAIDWSDEE